MCVRRDKNILHFYVFFLHKTNKLMIISYNIFYTTYTTNQEQYTQDTTSFHLLLVQYDDKILTIAMQLQMHLLLNYQRLMIM